MKSKLARRFSSLAAVTYASLQTLALTTNLAAAGSPEAPAKAPPADFNRLFAAEPLTETGIDPGFCGGEVIQDAHHKAGQSDRKGDRKGLEVGCKRGKIYIGGGAVLDTPQNSRKAGMWDTARGYGIVGYEDNTNPLPLIDSFGLFARVGYQNGGMLDGMHKTYLWQHKMSGGKGMRMSDGATDGTFYGGIAARAHSKIASFNLFGGNLALTTGAYGTAGNDEVRIGGQLFASYMFDGDGKFAPPTVMASGLPGLVENRGTGFAVGIDGSYAPYDTRLARSFARNHPLPAVIFAAQVDLNSIGVPAVLQASYQHNLVSEVRGESTPPVGIARLGLRVPVSTGLNGMPRFGY